MILCITALVATQPGGKKFEMPILMRACISRRRNAWRMLHGIDPGCPMFRFLLAIGAKNQVDMYAPRAENY